VLLCAEAKAMLIVGKGWMAIVDGTAGMSNRNTINDDYPDLPEI